MIKYFFNMREKYVNDGRSLKYTTVKLKKTFNKNKKFEHNFYFF